MEPIFGDFSNVNKHFFNAGHPKSKQWYNAYSNSKERQLKVISPEQLKLVRFFLSSNTAFTQLNNPHLRAALDPKININSWFTFRSLLYFTKHLLGK